MKHTSWERRSIPRPKNPHDPRASHTLIRMICTRFEYGTRQQRGHELEPKDEPVVVLPAHRLTAPEVEEEQKRDTTSRERSYRGAASLPRPDWSRPLPKLLIVSGVMTAATLNDVRVMVERHLPAASRAKEMWRYVSTNFGKPRLAATRREFSAVLEMVLSIEGLQWALK